MRYFSFTPFAFIFFISCTNQQPNPTPQTTTTEADSLRYPEEKHLRNVTQLTFGGDNAEAYFNSNGFWLTYQFTDRKDIPCDQIFLMQLKADGSVPTSSIQFSNFSLQFSKDTSWMVSNGKGRTTCSYFLPGDSLILYASTHLAADTCPQNLFMKEVKKYVWPIFYAYEIIVADLNGNIKKQLTSNNFYDAEATISPKGDRIVFTSTRSGDIELYTMNLDGSDVKQVTNELGYDGGAFFSPDGSKLVFRASRPKTEEEIKNYKDLLAKGLVAPTDMEIFICNADGSEMKQVTTLGKANWAPFFHPSGNKIIFCSNHQSEKGFPFHLYMINVDGTGLEQITFDPMFDSFPMFSPDGKYLVFCSNRNNKGTRDTNVFLAEWVE